VASGVLGSAYRTIRPQRLSFDPGDLLVLHTDGLRSLLDLKGLRELPAHAAAESLLASHCKSNDDAGCAVALGLPEASGARPSAPAVQVAPSFEGSRAIPVRERSDADCAALAARTFACEAGLGVRAQWEVGIAASELATNMIKFAGGGEIRLHLEPAPRAAVVVEAVDRGAGIADLDAALADGFSEGASRSPDRPRREGQGLGVGLGSVHRMMDRVEIETDHRGTRVVARKFAKT
jgi:serine/threonine-protein kinase RsbT